MKLILKNTVSKKEYEFDVDDLCTSKMCYSFNIELEQGMDEGSYEYTLLGNENSVLATGLCQLGDYEAEHKVYDNNNKTKYIQYNG